MVLVRYLGRYFRDERSLVKCIQCLINLIDAETETQNDSRRPEQSSKNASTTDKSSTMQGRSFHERA